MSIEDFDRGHHERDEPPVPHEPAIRFRRATDRYITGGYVAMAIFMWVVVVRVSISGDAVGGLIYAVPAAIMTWSAIAMAYQAFNHWRS